MDLSQVIIELRHSEPLKLFRPYEELYHSLTGKELPQKVPFLPGFQLDIAERRMRIGVDAVHTAMVFGEVPNIGCCRDNVMGVFRKVSELTHIPPLGRLGVRSLWLQESEVSFDELVSSYKEIIYKPNSIVEQSVDLGANFTLTDDKYAVTIMFGPMRLSQLETMFIFKPPKLPKVATFLDVDYFYLMKEPEEITAVMLDNFISRGLNYADKASQKLARILGGEER